MIENERLIWCDRKIQEPFKRNCEKESFKRFSYEHCEENLDFGVFCFHRKNNEKLVNLKSVQRRSQICKVKKINKYSLSKFKKRIENSETGCEQSSNDNNNRFLIVGACFSGNTSNTKNKVLLNEFNIPDRY